MWYVYIDTVSIKYGEVIYPHWKPFSNRISAMLFAKINGYKLIAKGK